MSTGTRLLAFVVSCAALFAAAFGVGRLTGPVASEPAAAADHGGMGDPDGMASMAGHEVGGLAASADGYSLRLAAAQLPAGSQVLTFTIDAPGGRPLAAYDEQHERDLHLVVVRRDLTGFQHLHPVLDEATGAWSTEVELQPGAWRVLADFVPHGGEKTVLGTDLLVPGEFAPVPLAGDVRTDEVDGHEVELTGAVDSHEETTLTATITRGGAPVTDLAPYLGAHGHLVALRDGDLGYLHVHPEDDGGAGPEVAFRTEFPSAGRYRLFLDFRHGGAVHTASFTVSDDDH